jgi:chemotaxis response regulator CheB
MRLRQIVVMGASAGGVAVMTRVLKRLPEDFSAVVFCVVHRPAVPWGASADDLVNVLGVQAGLRVRAAVDSERFQTGNVYVCPSNYHLLVESGFIRLERSPKEVYVRPSIDVLFRSAALSYGRRVIAVLLTGALYDGTSGLWEIKKRGGVTIVQDPSEVEFPAMPRTAIDNVAVDYVLPVHSIADKLIELTSQDAAKSRSAGAMPKVLIVEDEGVVAKNLELRLKKLGYEVVASVNSGEAAITAVADKGPDVVLPDIVLMDIYLAGRLTGVEAARRIWEQLQIPIVYITAFADLETLDEVKTTEAYGYVMKPFQTEAVHAAIQLALNRRERELRHETEERR